MKIRSKDEIKPEATEVVVVEKGGMPALPAQWATQLAEHAKDETAKEQPTTQAFSLRGGILSYGGQPLPGNKVNVIVLATGFERTLYINKFDANNVINPLCFALNEDGLDMVPHDNSYRKQNETCKGCPHDEWGSDENSPSKRGKACKEKRRLVVIPEDALKEGIDKAQMALIVVSVTNVRNWSQYVHMLAATAKRPPWSVVTEVSVKPDPKTQIQVGFTPIDGVSDPVLLEQLQNARERAMQVALNPYAMMTEEQYKEITAPKPAPKRKF